MAKVEYRGDAHEQLKHGTFSDDPLTAAVCTLDQIRDMVDETFAASLPYLPQFA